MTPTQLRKLASDPRFVPGIYNYCDRWCERCPLSHRCLNYSMQRSEDDGDALARDLNNQRFWHKLHDKFRLTLQMLKEEAEKRGIDLNAPDVAVKAAAHERRVRRRAAPSGRLAQISKAYGIAVQKWFEKSERLFKAKGIELAQKARMEIGHPLDEAEEIHELAETLQWYHLFIHVKLTRAIGSQAEEALKTDPELRAIMRDGDGSAKVALIGVDRSLAAWTQLRGHFPEQEDAILDLQVRLARIRQEAEKLFPNARSFVRPGFDEDLECLERGAD